ncbi:MAG: hypothetical protein C4542_07165 [Dehalococcoidia bacterium]|nr:MAG: hypothetical protein C4542_07165 [Dehalococcoidia bacterium]
MRKTDWPKCQMCGESVTTEDGMLTIARDDIDRFRNAVAAHGLKYAVELEIPPDPKKIHWSDFPKNAPWHWGHRNCLTEGFYSIPYGRFDTIEKVLSWTLHLMENHDWLDDTNWTVAVRAHFKVAHA